MYDYKQYEWQIFKTALSKSFIKPYLLKTKRVSYKIVSGHAEKYRKLQ